MKEIIRRIAFLIGCACIVWSLPVLIFAAKHQIDSHCDETKQLDSLKKEKLRLEIELLKKSTYITNVQRMMDQHTKQDTKRRDQEKEG